MTQLELSLDFVCLECEGNVGITVQCRGRGLQNGSATVTAVRVPCPNCGAISELLFRPLTGEVVDAVPLCSPCLLPVPSMN